MVSACGERGSLPASLETWSVYEGEGISLSLPDGYARDVSAATLPGMVVFRDDGSEVPVTPESPVTLAPEFFRTDGGLFSVFQIWMNPHYVSRTRFWNYALFLITNPDNRDSLPRVMAISDTWYGGNLKAYVEEGLRMLQAPWPPADPSPSLEVIKWTDVSSERIDLQVRIPGIEGVRPTVVGYWTFKEAGDSVFFIIYETDDSSFASSEPVFKASADTIVVQSK